MRRKLSKKTLRYKISHDSVAVLIIASLRKLKGKNKKLELQSKYHYERLIKESDPRQGYASEAIQQISREKRLLDMPRQNNMNYEDLLRK